MRLSRLMLGHHDFPVFLCFTACPVLLFMCPLFAPVGDVLSFIFCCIAGGLRTLERRESWGKQRSRCRQEKPRAAGPGCILPCQGPAVPAHPPRLGLNAKKRLIAAFTPEVSKHSVRATRKVLGRLSDLESTVSGQVFFCCRYN